MKTRPARNPLTVARNFAATHGEEGLRELLSMLTEVRTEREIGARFGISSQRVSQLAVDLGCRTRQWVPHLVVAEYLQMKPALREVVAPIPAIKPASPLTEKEVGEVRALLLAGASMWSIGLRYGVSPNTIQRIRDARTHRNVPPADLTPTELAAILATLRARPPGRRKLTDAQVVEIRAHLKSGASVVETAKRYGVSQQLVYAIRVGKMRGEVAGG